ncbi:hypothetical protein SRHO_G00187050 [Serrasalmus rhombeus]
MAEENETWSAFFFQRVRQAREERCFTSLIDSEGRACSDPARMMGIAYSFYSNLFSNRGTDREIGEHFLSFLKTSLPSAARDSLETPLSLGELTEVLGKMNRRKVPGLDGLPVEFYSTFWDVLGPEIVEVAEDVHRQGRSEDLRQGPDRTFEEDHVTPGSQRPDVWGPREVGNLEPPLNQGCDLLGRGQECPSGLHVVFRSDQSLRLALDMVQAFGNASGAALNLGPLKILGVSFMQEEAARANWEQRLGRYEYVKREGMYLGKDRGGRDVPDIPLKTACFSHSTAHAWLLPLSTPTSPLYGCGCPGHCDQS